MRRWLLAFVPALVGCASPDPQAQHRSEPILVAVHYLWPHQVAECIEEVMQDRRPGRTSRRVIAVPESNSVSVDAEGDELREILALIEFYDSPPLTGVPSPAFNGCIMWKPGADGSGFYSQLEAEFEKRRTPR